MTVKPIETQYKGFRFRSRLEARWAVFFDALGIEWQYEPEGFELSDGTRYLPDFFLPAFHTPRGIYVEVKGEEGSLLKPRRFAQETGWPVLLAVGMPDDKPFELATDDWASPHRVAFIRKAVVERRLWVLPEREDFEADGVIYAVHAARSARFEHGQSGSQR